VFDRLASIAFWRDPHKTRAHKIVQQPEQA